MKAKKILIIHLGGGIGDLLLSTSLPGQLKKNFPDASLSMMIRAEHRDIIEDHPFIDEIIAVAGGRFGDIGHFSRCVKSLKEKKFSLGIVLWSTAPVAWLLYLSGIPVRVGQNSRLLYSFLFTHRVAVRSEKGDVSSHWVECLLDYIRILGCAVSDPDVVISLNDKTEEKVDHLLNGLERPLIGLHVGKGLPLDSRRWPVNFFARLADGLHARFGGTLILTGDARESSLVASVVSLMKSNPLDLSGKTSLKELAAVIGRCQAFICPDSAPMHIAAAMKVPTVGIFALKSDFPARWGPYGTASEIIRPDPITCDRKCVKERCPAFQCYEQVSVEDVMAAVARLMSAGR